MMSGDINGDVEDFPYLEKMLAHEGWTDLGQHAYRWGTPTAARPTCWANNSNEATRGDYIFANHVILPYITGFGACPLGDLEVHAIVQVKLRKSITMPTFTQHKPPAN